MTTKILTAKNVTDAEISTFRAEAYSAGDYLMGAICDLAIDGEIDTDDYTTLDERETRKVRQMDQDDAIAAVVEALNSARASEEA